jgi:hypothetical protein
MIEQETFWTLLHDKAHWEFEIFLMVVFDLVLGGLLWPFVKKHWKRHIDRDMKEGLFDRNKKDEYLDQTKMDGD